MRGPLTGVYLAAEADGCPPEASPDDGAVLLLVVDDFVFPAFDVLPGCVAPRSGEGREGLKLVA